VEKRWKGKKGEKKRRAKVRFDCVYSGGHAHHAQPPSTASFPHFLETLHSLSLFLFSQPIPPTVSLSKSH